jgi:hypothetical protein
MGRKSKQPLFSKIMVNLFSFDLFGEHISFTVDNGNARHGSCVGLLMTLAVLGTVGVYGFRKYTDLELGTEIKHVTQINKNGNALNPVLYSDLGSEFYVGISSLQTVDFDKSKFDETTLSFNAAIWTHEGSTDTLALFSDFPLTLTDCLAETVHSNSDFSEEVLEALDAKTKYMCLGADQIENGYIFGDLYNS